VGVGVNLRLPPEWHARLGQPVTDLATLCGGRPPERNALAARLIDHLRTGLITFEEKGLVPFVPDFARRDALAGQALTLTGAGDLHQGVGRGIDARGALRVEHAGQVHTIQSSHVSVRLQPSSGGG
jgi:BirA family biotin operon repressor/biotin-[acetyl-CoA-carboxylase] ligase